jgi:hypothetical protein
MPVSTPLAPETNNPRISQFEIRPFPRSRFQSPIVADWPSAAQSGQGFERSFVVPARAGSGMDE